MIQVFVGLGSNLGNREEHLQRAVDYLSNQGSKFQPLEISPIYETAPQIVVDQPSFLNGVLKACTSLSPLATLQLLKEAETAVGRLPRQRYGPRECDLDLLLYGQIRYCFSEGGKSILDIPHASIRQRRFVLQPLFDLLQDSNLPSLGSLGDLLQATEDQRDEIVAFQTSLRLGPHTSDTIT